MKRLGLDLGTKHIVLSWRDEKNKIKTRYEVNGYITLERTDAFTEQFLIKNEVPYITRGNEFIAIGSKAEKLAYTFNKNLKRPMAEGGVSRNDEDAQEIIAVIIRSIIGKLTEDALLYYCTTAAPINTNNLNIDFQKKIVKLIIEGYESDKAKITAHHINEARCLIIEEAGTAIGISWGAGTVTIHAGVFGVPVFEFSISGSGDWLDIEVAKRFGYDPDNPDKQSRETPTSVCRRKEKIDLMKVPEDKVDQAIVLMYDILIENVVTGIIKGFRDNRTKFRPGEPVKVINAGGTSMPPGFTTKLYAKLDAVKDQLTIPIGEVTQAPDPLFAVARGALIACEAHK